MEGCRVFVHPYDAPEHLISKHNKVMTFSRVPNVGEFVYLESGGEWYRVELVVHCASETNPSDMVAEITVVKASHLDELRNARYGSK